MHRGSVKTQRKEHTGTAKGYNHWSLLWRCQQCNRAGGKAHRYDKRSEVSGMLAHIGSDTRPQPSMAARGLASSATLQQLVLHSTVEAVSVCLVSTKRLSVCY